MPLPPTKENRSEEAAEAVTVEGWACKHCHRFWGIDERMARYCCSTSFPCECGKRYTKHQTMCDDCANKKRAARWFDRTAIEWDGEFPIANRDGDDYFFNASDLLYYLTELYDVEEEEEAIEKLDDGAWLTTCKQNDGRYFDMSEYLCDELAPDQELDCNEINDTVNAWIKEHAPFSWSQTGERLDIESVKRRLLEKTP